MWVSENPYFRIFFVVFTKNLSSWYDGLPTLEIIVVRQRSLSETPFFNLCLWLWYKFFQMKTLLSRAYYIPILFSSCRFCVCRFKFSLQLFFCIMIKLTKDVGEDVFLYFVPNSYFYSLTLSSLRTMMFLILEKFSNIYRNLYGARVGFIFHTYFLALFSND